MICKWSLLKTGAEKSQVMVLKEKPGIYPPEYGLIPSLEFTK